MSQPLPAWTARPQPCVPSHGDETPDEEAVALAKHDPCEFAILYHRYLDPVHRYCFRRLGNREAAEDATSLIFANALAALPRYRAVSFRSWLFTIAHHLVTDRFRTADRERPLDTVSDIHDTARSPEELAVTGDERRSLRALLAQLPEHQRQVVELRLAGLSGAEIAQVLGRSAANVDVTQWRAVARLRELLRLESRPRETTHGK